MNIEHLVDEFGKEFEENVYPNLPDSQYGNLESMLLYCLIRKRKPRFLAEIGTEIHGRSSYIIQKALVKNDQDSIHAMFDVPGVAERALRTLIDQGLGSNVWLFSGFVESTIQALSKKKNLKEVDFMFIDADHEDSFALWYIKNVIEKLSDGTLVHVHDVNTTDKLERESPIDTEERVLRDLKKDGKLPLKSLISFDNICKLEENLDLWKRIQKKHDFIGEPFPTEFPHICCAEYFEKK